MLPNIFLESQRSRKSSVASRVSIDDDGYAKQKERNNNKSVSFENDRDDFILPQNSSLETPKNNYNLSVKEGKK